MCPPSTHRPDSDDARFVAGLQAGDVTLFEQLYRTWFHDLAKYGATFLPDDDAGDLVQDVFLSLWRHRDQLSIHTDQELFHYLLRAVRNRAFDVLRHDRVWSTYVSSVFPTLDVEENRGEVTNTEYLLAHVHQLIETLPPRSREVLVLRWYHGLNFEQISSIMGISYGSAHVLHSRALAMVRKQFEVREKKEGA